MTTAPDQPDQPDQAEPGFTSVVTADIVADVEHPDPESLTDAERRHLGITTGQEQDQ